MRRCTEPRFLAAALGALLLFACAGDSAKKHYVLAEKLWTDGSYAAAVGEFERAAAKDPHGKLGLNALFRAAMTQSTYLSQYDDAVKKFRRYVESNLDPKTGWEAKRQIGDVLFSKMEQYDQAIQQYEAMLKERPASPEAPELMFRISKSHFFLREFGEAAGSYRELIHRYPTSPWAEEAAYEIGVTYFTRGEQHPGGRGPGMETYQDAMDAFQKFIKLYPKSKRVTEAQFGIASCLEELDQLDAAFHAYEAILHTYPSPKVILIKLARIRDRKAQRNR